MNHILKNAIVNAVGTVLYVVIIATFLSNAQNIFGPEEPKTVLVPIGMLLLLVLSAAITGSLVFGRPVLWYLDGKKREAVSLLIYTFISIFVVLVFIGCLFLVLE